MAPRKVIVGYGQGERSRDALRFAAVVAGVAHAELVVAHVYRDDQLVRGASLDARMPLRVEAMRRLNAAERLLPYGTRAELRAVSARSPVQGLHDLAESESADLIVVGTTTRGSLELHAVGSIPERLLHAAPCAVAVAPRGYADELGPGLRVIGVAYDGSSEGRQALEEAAELAMTAGAAMKVIGVAERPPPPTAGMSALYLPDGGSYRDAMLHELERAADELPARLRPQVVLADGEPASELIKRAEPLSLLVMGSRAYGPLRRALLGSVSAPVLRAAPCPVVVVPRGAARNSARPTAEASSG